MDGSVQELINKAGKLALESEMPKYSTNWCDIPMEMRAECIKRMDFRTKTCLRATSHTEKALVDREKHRFDCVDLSLTAYYGPPFYSIFCRTRSNNGQNEEFSITSKKMYRSEEELLIESKKKCKFVAQILKNCEIDTFKANITDLEGQDLWTEIEKCAPFRFKKFVWFCDRFNKSLLMLLNNIDDVEEIRITFAKSSFTELMSIPAVLNTKRLEISYHPPPDDIHAVVQRWIDEDSAIGKSFDFRFWQQTSDVFKSFNDKFKNRVIYKKGKEVRIRTDNESKHILLRHFGFHFLYTIIPSNLLESEYKTLNIR